MSGLSAAVDLCREIEKFAPEYGCHVALTRGCLYKEGSRKDIDILFYRIRQVEKVDVEGLKKALVDAGMADIRGFGWLLKANYKGHEVDMFFPEEIGNEDYQAAVDRVITIEPTPARG